jgi:hypothetical protein
MVVVLDASFALNFLTEADAIVDVEVVPEGGCPRECPTHASLMRLQFRERRSRYRPEHHVVVSEVNLEAIESICNGRARRAASGVVESKHVVGSKHEVIDEKLRPPSKEVR